MSRRMKSPDQIELRNRAEAIRHRTRLDLMDEGLPEKTAAEFARRAALSYIEGATFAVTQTHRAVAWAMACYSEEQIALEREMPGDGSACGAAAADVPLRRARGAAA